MSSPSMISPPWQRGSRASSRAVLTLALVMLFGCSSAPPKQETQASAVPTPPPPTLPRPQPLSLEDVTWRVAKTGDSPFCLDARGYEALSRNMAGISGWIQEASWQIDFYRQAHAVPPKGTK